MGISTSEAEKIHKLAQAAGIPDETVEAWTEAEGGYRYAITSHAGSIKSAGAQAVRNRIKRYTPEQMPPAAADTQQAAPTATPRQVDYIVSLLAKREREGDGGGFMSGPTTRDDIAKLSKFEASTYITSLREDY